MLSDEMTIYELKRNDDFIQYDDYMYLEVVQRNTALCYVFPQYVTTSTLLLLLLYYIYRVIIILLWEIPKGQNTRLFQHF